MKKRWIVFAAFAALLTASVLALTTLFTTEAGLNSVMQLVQRTVPGTLNWQSASGRLIGPLQLEGVDYQDASGQYRFAQISLDWSPGRLLARRLSIHQLYITDVDIALAETASETDTAPIEPGWALPLEVLVRDLAVKTVRIKSSAAEPVVIDALTLGAGSGLEWLDIQQLHLAMPQLAVDVQGRLGLGQDVATDLMLAIRLTPPDYAPIAMQGQLSGTWEQLLLTQQLSAPITAQARIDIQQPFADLRWVLELDAPVFTLTQINATWPAQQIGGKLHGSGTLTDADLSADLQTDWAAQQLFPLHAEMTLVTADDGSLQLQPLLLEQGDSRLRLIGNWSAEAQRFSALLNAQKFNWPLVGEPQLHLPEAELKVKGGLQDYQLSLTGRVEAGTLPPADVQVAAQGDQNALRIDNLELQTLDGLLRSRGELAWAPRLRWDIQVDATDINPGQQWPDWPGKLSAQVHSSGSDGTQGLALSAHLAQLGGNLRGYPLSGSGTIAMQNAQTQVESLLLQSGDARVELNGRVAEHIDLDWTVRAPDLQQLLPGLTGAVDARGTLSGTRAQPRVQAQATLSEIASAQLRVKELQLDADLSLQPGAALMLKGRGTSLRIGEREFDSLTLDLSGPLERHSFSVQAQGAAHALHLTAQGAWKDAVWQGRIERGDWRVPELGAWTLAQPVALRLSAQQGAVERVCWRQQATQLCSQFDYDARERRVQAQLRDWPLTNLQAYLPPDVRIDKAMLAGQLNAVLPVQGDMRAQASMTLSAGTVNWMDAGQTVITPFGGADAQMDLDANGLRSTAQLRLSGTDQLNLQASLPGYQPSVIAAQQRLDGQLRGEVRDFALLNALVTNVDDLSGAFNLEAALAGTLGEPTLQGELRLTDGRGFIGPAGVQLEDWQATLAGDPLDGALRLQSSARSGPGTVILDGRLAHLGSDQLEGEFKLGGSGFEAMNMPEARVLVTPDLRAVIRGQSAEVNGTLHIPEARIEPRDLSAAVTASKDVVLVTQGQAPPPGWTVSSRIKLSLGDKVLFNGYGLSGRLTGMVEVTDVPRRIPLARGELAVKDGIYEAYGQELKIEQGRVLYRDSPLDDPALDVRAVRKTGDITAGVRVRGTAQDPLAELYSQPSLPQADALSYLLLGRPVASASGSEGEMLFKAASTVGLKGGNALAQNIGNSFGLDEVTVGGGDDLESAALTVGKYLSPKLYVNYSVGLLDAANKIQMRYQLSKRLTLQTETGLATGGDVLYTIER